MKPSPSNDKIDSPTTGIAVVNGSRGSGGLLATSTTTPTKKSSASNNNNHQHHHHHHNNLSPKVSANSNTNNNENGTTLDISNPKCESISSNEKDIEYLRVVFPHNANDFAHTSNELSVDYNEIVKLIEDDNECLDCDKSWIKVFNSQGITGMIPSTCVEPILDNLLINFVFIRHPTSVGLFARNSWYFGNITRFETILLFNKYANFGDFLVRDSDVRKKSLNPICKRKCSMVLDKSVCFW